MSWLRFTPFNIVAALLSCMMLWPWISGESAVFSYWLLGLLLALFVFSDVLFRVLLKFLKRIWRLELLLLGAVVLLIWIIRLF